MRKDAGFDVTDRIAISFSGTDAIVRALESTKEYIMSETLAASLVLGNAAGDHSSSETLNGESCEISIGRI
jgi:isoleucyl-tRNA synthetase